MEGMCLCACVTVVFRLSVCQWRSGCPQWGVFTKRVRKVLAPALHQRQYWLKAWDCLCSQSSLDGWQCARTRGDAAESNQQPAGVKCFVAGGMCLNSDLRTTHRSALEWPCPNSSSLPRSYFNSLCWQCWILCAGISCAASVCLHLGLFQGLAQNRAVINLSQWSGACWDWGRA